MTPSVAERIDDRVRALLGAWEERSRKGPRVFYATLLGEDPPVVVIWDYTLRQIAESGVDAWARWKDAPALIIINPSWEIATPERLDGFRTLIGAHQAKHPRHRLVCLLNSEAERGFLLKAGAEVLDCHQNALVDENIFKPAEGARAGGPREFDAVYNARFARYKRHQLAKGVRSLALIHYTGLPLFEPLWWAATRWRMRHARIINRHKWGVWPQWIMPKEVAATYNRSRVGLCLSEVEGGMLASIQYLLCGLPVVTTPSRGGRDVFFDADNTLVVEPRAEAVADGVRAMIARNLDPWAIRERTLARMAEHRGRLVAFVESFQREHGVPEDRRLSREWPLRLAKAGRARLP